MKYEVEENFTLSAYYAKIICDEDIYSKLNNNTCMIITDSLDGTTITYNYTDLIENCGLTKIDNPDYSCWLEESFIENSKNNFMFFNVNNNTIETKLLTKCYSTLGSGEHIGFNPSQIDIYINGLSDDPITIKSRYSPYIERVLPYNLNEETEEILYNENYNIRRDFDYNNDQLIKEPEKIPYSNIKYNTVGDIYLNNRPVNDRGESLTKSPLYVSDVSAVTATWITEGGTEVFEVSSYIHDDETSEIKNIPYELIDSDRIEVNPFGSYISPMYYGKFRQYLNQPEGGFARNEVIFELKIQNSEIEPPPPPPPTANLVIRPNTTDLNIQCSMNYDRTKWGKDTWDDYGKNPNLSEQLCYYYDKNNESETVTKDLKQLIENNTILPIYPSRITNHDHILTRTWSTETNYDEDHGFIRVTVWNPYKQGLIDFEDENGDTYKVFYQYENNSTHMVEYLESVDEVEGYTRLIDVWCWEHPREEADIAKFKSNLQLITSNNSGEIIDSSFDTENYVSNGYINFNISKISISLDDEYTDCSIKFSLGYNAGWDNMNGSNSDNHKWTLNNKPFIPPEYDNLFSKYVLFTNGFISLDKAYIGIKDIICTGLRAWNNSEIAAEVYITGNGDYYMEDNKNVAMMKLNNNDGGQWSPTIPKKQYYNDSLPEENFEDCTNITYTTGGKLVINDTCPTILHFNSASENGPNYRVEQSNGSAIGGYTYSALTDLPVLPKESIEYKGSGSIDINRDGYIDPTTNRPRMDFDAKGNILDLGSITGGNNCTITFEPGEYHFNGDFVFDTNVNIIINDCTKSKGMKYVRIYAKNFSFSNGFNLTNNSGIEDTMSLWLYAENNFTAAATTSSEDNVGVIIAQNTIDVKQNFFWTGAMWANLLKIGENSRILSY